MDGELVRVLASPAKRRGLELENIMFVITSGNQKFEIQMEKIYDKLIHFTISTNCWSFTLYYKYNENTTAQEIYDDIKRFISEMQFQNSGNVTEKLNFFRGLSEKFPDVKNKYS